MRRRAFDLADELADREHRRDGHCHVDVGFRAANLVEERPGRVDDLLLHAAMGHVLHLRSEQREAVLAVPGDVQIDLAVIVAAHGAGRLAKETRERA